MKRILSLTLSLLMLMSMVTIVGATTDSNVVWQEDFNGNITVGEIANKEITVGNTVKFVDEYGNRLQYAEVSLKEAAYGKGNHEKSLFIYHPAYSGDNTKMHLDATFPQGSELPIADGQKGRIAFDWINFTAGWRYDNPTGGRRQVKLKVKFVNEAQEELVENVSIGELYSNFFRDINNSDTYCALGHWNRLSVYIDGNTLYVSPFQGAAWKSYTFSCTQAGYEPVAVTGIWAEVGFIRDAVITRLYGFDNFIAEKVDAVPTVGAANTEEKHPVYLPFINVGYVDTVIRNTADTAIYPGYYFGPTSIHPSSVAIPENATATLYSQSFPDYNTVQKNAQSDHEWIFDNAAGYYITDVTERATVMGSDAYTMNNGLSIGAMTGLSNGSKVHYGFKFKYTGEEHGAKNHILMDFQVKQGGNFFEAIRMKSDGTLINVYGEALTKLAVDTYYKVDILCKIGNASTATVAEVYINGKLVDTAPLFTRDTDRFQDVYINYYGEPKGEAKDVDFSGVTATAVEYYAHSLHIDDVYINNVATMGAFNKTPYVAYDLNKSLSEATDKIAAYGIVLDPGSMTASRVSNDFTAASFLAAVNLPNVSVVSVDGSTETALTGNETLVGNKIKITGEFGATVYYNAVSTGANIANTDFVLAATQNGTLVSTTCASGTALTVTAVDNEFETPQIFVAEYEILNGDLKLVDCKGGVGSASLTPSEAGNTVKVFVVNTKDGLKPLYDANQSFTVQ